MRELGDADVLDVWQRTAPLAGPARLRALAVVGSGVDGDVLDDQPLGVAHGGIVSLVRAVAGSTMASTVACPACGEVVEFVLEADDLLAAARDGQDVSPVECEDWLVSWSPLTLRGFAAAAATGRPAAVARDRLLDQVVDEVKAPDGSGADTAALPTSVVAALGRAQTAADPLVEIVVDLTCSACATAVAAEVDVAAHAISALTARATRLLDDVHTLARAYGWTEQETLALPAPRRAAYLDRVRAGAP